jgi:hypothetical protein
LKELIDHAAETAAGEIGGADRGTVTRDFRVLNQHVTLVARPASVPSGDGCTITIDAGPKRFARWLPRPT